MSTFPHRKPPKPRHMERRSGRATARLRDAYDGPLDADAPLAPEAYEKARASRKRHASRRPESKIEDETEAILLALGAVAAILIVLFLIGLVLTS